MELKNKRDPLIDQLREHLALKINPRSIQYIGKLRPLQRKLNFLKKIRLAPLYEHFRPNLGLVVNSRIEYRLFVDSRKYKFMKELWDADFDYRNTEWYLVLKHKIDKGDIVEMPVKGYHLAGMDDLETYFMDYVNLLKSMKTEGFLPDKGRDELRVIIDPEGEILKTSKGRHRLAAAQIVGIDQIPVRVRHIHKKWIDRQTPARGQDITLKDKIIQAMDKVRLRTK